MEVEPARVDREEHERRKKNPHSRNPKRVVHLKMRKIPIRLSLLLSKITNKINAKERWMMMSLFLLIMKK
jgi:hypothetical protein